jgi:hypothetical protein
MGTNVWINRAQPSSEISLDQYCAGGSPVRNVLPRQARRVSDLKKLTRCNLKGETRSAAPAVKTLTLDIRAWLIHKGSIIMAKTVGQFSGPFTSDN